jgi:hypothetical protein
MLAAQLDSQLLVTSLVVAYQWPLSHQFLLATTTTTTTTSYSTKITSATTAYPYALCSTTACLLASY